MSDRNIHIVSCDEECIEIIRSALSDNYNLIALSGADDLENILSSSDSKMLLLDMDCEGLDALQECKSLKEGFEVDDVPVIFISSRSDFEIRVQSYEAGAEDFIEKPLHKEEFLARVQAVFRYQATVEELKEKADSAMQTVLSMITSSGELSYVVDFLRSSYKSDSVEALVDCLLQTCEDYGLKVIARLAAGDQVFYRGNCGDGTPLEQSLFDHVPENIRIHSFSNRCVFKYGEAAILVKNMPVDDADKCGRIRDNIAIVAEGARAALRSILSAERIKAKTQELQNLMEQSCQILELFKDKSGEQRIASAEIMSDMIEQVEIKFMHLGLTLDQEQELITIIKKSDEKQDILYKVGDALEMHLTQLIFGFEKALRQSR